MCPFFYWNFGVGVGGVVQEGTTLLLYVFQYFIFL